MEYKRIFTGVSAITMIATLAFSVPLQNKKLEESKARGKELYGELCITCHLGDGKGTPGTIPPLAKSSYFAKNIDKAIYAQKFGLSEPITVNGIKYSVPMPAPGISDEEIADITTYITNSWGNKGRLITVKDVQRVTK